MGRDIAQCPMRMMMGVDGLDDEKANFDTGKRTGE